MDQRYYGIVEILFTATIVFGLGLWQLWSLKRDKSSTRRVEEKKQDIPPTG